MNAQTAKKLEEKILGELRKTILKRNKDSKETCIILGLSSGPDSVFLLHMLSQLPITVVAAHVNHCLRGKDSEKDQKFAETLTKTIIPKGEIISETVVIDIKKLAKSSKIGTEEAGRNARYDFFEKLAKKHKAICIITAHHADDNLETILFNLTRGTTLKGLTGIDPITKTKKGTLLFRPLLQTTKDEILGYLKLKKLKFKTDKSNKDTKYARNYIRNVIIPLLKKLNPNIAKTTAKNTQNLREIDEYLSKEAEKFTKTLPLDAKTFRKQPIALKKAIIHSLYKNNLKDLNKLKAINVDEVIALIDQNVGNKKKSLGEITISIKNNGIRVDKIQKTR